MRLVEDGTLDVTDNIAILTDDLAQSHFADLGQLGLAEPRFSRVVLVPKAIAALQFLELNADDAGKSGAHQSPLQGSFAQAAGEQVDVIHVLVDLLESLDHILADFFVQVLEIRGLGQLTSHSVLVVGPQPVIPAALDIQCGQIQAGISNAAFLKQVVGDFAGHELILIFHGSTHQTSHNLRL